jgi:thiol-disulfide isomerase/thioredoxin
LKKLDFLLEPYNPSSKYKQFKPNENPEKYFEEIETLIKQIRTMEVEKVPAFRFWLAKIIVNYSNFGVRYIEDSKKFETKFNEVAKNFTGLVKDAYLTSLILNDKYNQYSSDYLNTYFEICNNDGFKEKISEINNQRNWKSNETLLKTTVLKDKNNIETTWSDIIESRKGKIIYVDFWASWCGGCKINLPKIKELKKKFPDLEIVFISKDAEEAKWISSFNTWEFGDIGSHYLLNPTTELAKLLTMPSIPRGTLIDKKGKIITTYTDVANSDSLIKQINQMYLN